MDTSARGSAIDALGLPKSRWVDVRGPVHYREWSGPASGPTFVLVHGLGGSHLNWALVAPELARLGRVLVPDLVGFGLTPRAGRSSGIGGNWRLLDGFLRALDLPPVVLSGNSMGGMLALIQAAHAPRNVHALLLTNAAFPRPRGHLGLSTKLAFGFLLTENRWLGPRIITARAAHVGAEGLVRETIETCAADPRAVDPAVVAAQIELLETRLDSREATLSHVEATHSIVWAHTFPARYRALVDRVTTPALVIHGAHDRLVPLPVARLAVERHPGWRLAVFPDAGHIPQLETPERWLAVVEGWLAERGVLAA